MTITQSGVYCDVCGGLLWSNKDTFEFFEVEELDSGNSKLVVGTRCCRQQLKNASDANDWELLPRGPMRKVYQEAAERIKKDG
jgi:hypothetical protein